METTITDRLNELIHKYHKGNQAKFCSVTGISTSKVSAWCTGKFEPKYESLLNIIKSYPDMSIRWLMTGEGSINSKDEYSTNNTSCPNCAELQKQIQELKQDKERLWLVITGNIDKKQ